MISLDPESIHRRAATEAPRTNRPMNIMNRRIAITPQKTGLERLNSSAVSMTTTAVIRPAIGYSTGYASPLLGNSKDAPAGCAWASLASTGYLRGLSERFPAEERSTSENASSIQKTGGRRG